MLLLSRALSKSFHFHRQTNRCCFSTGTSDNAPIRRLGLGSYKHQSMSKEVIDETVRVALENGFGALEATSIIGAQGLADAYRAAVKSNDGILEHNIQLLLRIGYREKEDSNVFADDVRQPDGAIHNISAEYVQLVLQESPFTKLCHDFPESVSLQVALHNPEVQGDGSLDSQWVVHDVLADCFRSLEDWCTGCHDSLMVNSYGVASNGLVLPKDHPLHLGADIIVNAAERATSKRGMSFHNTSFGFIQLPVNALEGQSVAREIRERGYSVYGMRPLKAYESGGVSSERPILLADYQIENGMWTNETEETPRSYDTALKVLLSHLDADETADEDTIIACRLLQNTIQDLDATEFATMEHHYAYVANTVVPALSKIDAYDEETSGLLEDYFHQHGNAVRVQVAQRTRQRFSAPNSVRLQEYALQTALASADKVILNCSSVDQVRDIIKVASKLGQDKIG